MQFEDGTGNLEKQNITISQEHVCAFCPAEDWIVLFWKNVKMKLLISAMPRDGKMVKPGVYCIMNEVDVILNDCTE